MTVDTEWHGPDPSHALHPLHRKLYERGVKHAGEVYYALVCRVAMGSPLVTKDGHRTHPQVRRGWGGQTAAGVRACFAADLIGIPLQMVEAMSKSFQRHSLAACYSALMPGRIGDQEAWCLCDASTPDVLSAMGWLASVGMSQGTPLFKDESRTALTNDRHSLGEARVLTMEAVISCQPRLSSNNAL